jgi:hypothetical protein
MAENGAGTAARSGSPGTSFAAMQTWSFSWHSMTISIGGDTNANDERQHNDTRPTTT